MSIDLLNSNSYYYYTSNKYVTESSHEIKAKHSNNNIINIRSKVTEGRALHKKIIIIYTYMHVCMHVYMFVYKNLKKSVFMQFFLQYIFFGVLPHCSIAYQINIGQPQFWELKKK